nr:glutamate dehydrogenase, mitochondrial-like [Onthophagus taurus]
MRPILIKSIKNFLTPLKPIVFRRNYVDIGKIPFHLVSIPDQENPSFLDVVVYNYHKARLIVENKLIAQLQPMWTETIARPEREEKARGILSAMEDPESVLEINFPIRMDDGNYIMHSGFAVHYKAYNVPVVVPVRFGLDMTRGKTTALAKLMTYKCGFGHIPFGGGSAGLVIDRRKYSQKEMRRVTRQFASELVIRGFVGPNIGIVSPDKGVQPKEMNYILTMYRRTYGYSDIHASTLVTGRKPLKFQQNINSVAGGFIACLEYLISKENLMSKHKLTTTLEGKTYISQGCGKLALQIASVLSNKGSKLIAVQSTKGSIMNKNGIDVKSLIKYRIKHGNIIGFPGAEAYKGENVLFEPCDIILLAATHLLINEAIASKINAKVVAELANAPITPSGDKALIRKNVLIIPDILANAGQLTVSYIEWLQKMYPVNNMILRYKRMTDYDTLKSIEDSLQRQAYKVQIQPKPDIVERAKGIKYGEMEWVGLMGITEQNCQRVINIADQYQLGPDLRTAAHIGAILHIFGELSNRL